MGMNSFNCPLNSLETKILECISNNEISSLEIYEKVVESIKQQREYHQQQSAKCEELLNLFNVYNEEINELKKTKSKHYFDYDRNGGKNKWHCLNL